MCAWQLGTTARTFTWPYIIPIDPTAANPPFSRAGMDQFIKVMCPPVKVEDPGPSLNYRYQATSPGVSTYSEGTVGGAPFTEPTFSGSQVNFARLGTEINMDVLTRLASNNPGDVLDKAISFAKTHVIYALGRFMIEGDGAGLFNGLKQKIVAGQQIKANNGAGGAMTLHDVYQLVHLVRCMDPSGPGTGSDCLVMAPRTQRALVKLIHAAGSDPVFAFSQKVGSPVLMFAGIPCYIGQVSEVEEAGDRTSIWALKLRGESGVNLLSGGGGDENGVEVTQGPPAYTGAASAYTQILAYVHGLFALLVTQDQQIARLYDIDNTGVQ